MGMEGERCLPEPGKKAKGDSREMGYVLQKVEDTSIFMDRLTGSGGKESLREGKEGNASAGRLKVGKAT